METYSKKCPSCGGSQMHEIGNHTYECDYCGETFVIKGEPESASDTDSSSANVSILLENVGNSQLQVVKALSDVTKYDLATCKACVDNVPCVIVENVEKQEAQAVCSELVKAGATVQLVEGSRPVDIKNNYKKESGGSGCMSVIVLLIVSTMLLTTVL